ncbi:TetR/AcrR family transcriptional regulator [Endozoicomonas sp. SCSIO W0465]|uniref:TetR/AcrR family transcriptional regulator n=1 Tax=Endozoicomonas sp. SCSIO W0465 TaxID=2918516 RepID=UPI002074EB91|nr:helix-turn-helix domain-containing protein [Endozoicomonas sp. SCSIO W0465]USE34291.1 TetR/AcrR family transcriptional regulator [Endozoicomonas sp. SCSIO W0465]
MTVQTMGRRERKKQAVRDKISEETIALIRRQGVDGATVEAICERADIAKKTFYNYYSSRHELMIEICDAKILVLNQELVEAALGSGKPLEAQLTFLFDQLKTNYTHADHFEKELIDYMVCNFPNHRSQGVNQLNFMNTWYTRLYEHNATRLKPSLTPDFCAEVTVAMVNGLTLNWLNDEQYDIEARLDKLRCYLIDSFLGG